MIYCFEWTDHPTDLDMKQVLELNTNKNNIPDVYDAGVWTWGVCKKTINQRDPG